MKMQNKQTNDQKLLLELLLLPSLVLLLLLLLLRISNNEDGDRHDVDVIRTYEKVIDREIVGWLLNVPATC